MGINRTSFVVYGVSVKYNKSFSDMYYDLDNPPREFDVVIDSMGGEYMVIGKILASFERNRDTPFTSIDIDSLEDIAISCREKFIQVFPEYDYFVYNHFKLLAFDYYS